jgi:hypothetical protein
LRIASPQELEISLILSCSQRMQSSRWMKLSKIRSKKRLESLIVLSTPSLWSQTSTGISMSKRICPEKLRGSRKPWKSQLRLMLRSFLISWLLSTVEGMLNMVSWPKILRKDSQPKRYTTTSCSKISMERSFVTSMLIFANVKRS